jgi:hypothetical protein
MNAPLSRAVISLSLLTLGACCAASCGARTQGAERATRPATEDVVTVDARDAVTVDVASGCGSDRDCAPGERCLGAPGCGAPWACTPVVGCLRDLTLYCGCDGRTRAGSSDCPGSPYAQRGPCNPGLCAAVDARAEGDCAREMGYVWDGFSNCLPLTGCECVGAGCSRAMRTEAECIAAHASCTRE